MATIPIITTERQDRAAQVAARRYNADNPGRAPMTVVQFVQARVTQILDSLADRIESEDREAKAELYRLASDADKLLIDTTLAKYR